MRCKCSCKQRLGPDQFQLLFFSMEQGDCWWLPALMVKISWWTADREFGKLGCNGSGAGTAAIQLDSRSPDANRNLTALILTHRDIDHINKVDEILSGNTNYPEYDNLGQPTGRKRGPYRAITVDQVYFSDIVEDGAFQGQPAAPVQHQRMQRGDLQLFKCPETELRHH